MYLEQEMGNTSEDYLGFLSLVDIFESLSAEEVEALSREGQEANLRVGEILYAPADRCEPLFVLKRSRVRLYRETLEGRKFTLAVIEGGTIFGEGSLASRRSRNAYAECVVRDPGPLHPPPARDHDRDDEPRGGHARLRAAQGGRADGVPHHPLPGHRSLTKVVRGGRNLSHRVRCHNRGVAGARYIAPGRPNDSQAAGWPWNRRGSVARLEGLRGTLRAIRRRAKGLARAF